MLVVKFKFSRPIFVYLQRVGGQCPRCLAASHRTQRGLGALMDFNPPCLAEMSDGWLVFNVQNETGQ
jgi:hypothetical protein